MPREVPPLRVVFREVVLRRLRLVHRRQLDASIDLIECEADVEAPDRDRRLCLARNLLVQPLSIWRLSPVPLHTPPSVVDDEVGEERRDLAVGVELLTTVYSRGARRRHLYDDARFAGNDVELGDGC